VNVMEFIDDSTERTEDDISETKNQSVTEEEERCDVIVNKAIQSDHIFIRETLPPAAVLTLTKEYVTVVIMRTAYSRVQLRIQYTPQYPDEVPIVELTSPSLPQPLLRNKEKECLEAARNQLGSPQVQTIFTLMDDFIHMNLFTSCWKEVKQVMGLCNGLGKIGADEKEGILQLRLRQGAYKQSINLRVPYTYPEEGVEIEFKASSFPQDIQSIFLSQAEEICRRCVAGCTAEQATQPTNRSAVTSRTTSEIGAPAVRLTTENLKSLKHDVDVLKQMTDLRDVNVSKDKRNQGLAHSTAARREARKDLRRLAKSEAASDAEQLAAMRQQEQREVEALMRTKISDTAQPSLLPVATFLVQEYVRRMPSEPCQSCGKPVLPENPTEYNTTSGKKAKNAAAFRPMRTFCGHWLHFSCLDNWLTTPPFIRQCPVCDRRIWHPDWPEDVKTIERAWQNEQARKREMADVADFLDMGNFAC